MLKIYNTLTRRKEEFIPIDKLGKEVKIYSCGPTVYNYAHIGNLRSYIFMDTLRKVLKWDGYKLKHVMNITDVGHLVSDADEGEDKMAKSAREKNMSVYDIANMYTEAFIKDIEAINIEKPEYILKATDHIKEMEEYVSEIVRNGYGYETSKGIYFDTSKLPTYGELSRTKLEDLKAGARIEVDLEKRSPLDFALWIKAPEEHIMKWPSRWGECYPGWHIECSAMSRKVLGDKFDIHTGGVDHIPVHHENEIAQSKGATGKNPANYWMHNEFLLIDSGKMSKSLGNVYTLFDFKERNIEPLAYRFFTYTSKYTNKLNFTWEAVESAQVSLNRLREAYLAHINGEEKIDEKELSKFREQFTYALNDDLNMPVALSIVWEVSKDSRKSKDFANLLHDFDKILSIEIDKNIEKQQNDGEEEIKMPSHVEQLVAQRKAARKNKDFALSDELRDKIEALGFRIIDSKEGQKIEKI